MPAEAKKAWEKAEGDVARLEEDLAAGALGGEPEAVKKFGGSYAGCSTRIRALERKNERYVSAYGLEK